MKKIKLEGTNASKRDRPTLLRAAQFLGRPADFQYFDVDGEARAIALVPGSLAFTCCQVPVVYERVTGRPWIRVTFADGAVTEIAGDALDAPTSGEIFSRNGRVARLRIGVPQDELSRL